jgi:hypothetical protein
VKYSSKIHYEWVISNGKLYATSVDKCLAFRHQTDNVLCFIRDKNLKYVPWQPRKLFPLRRRVSVKHDWLAIY